MAHEIAYGPDVAGGLEHYKRRELPDGALIEFEEAPIGYLTKKGEPRKAPWRAYFHTPAGAKRTRLTSVSTLLDTVTSMGGLPYWYEKGGIKGAHEAHRQGLLVDSDTDDWAVIVVRREKLGADAERDRAADRGLSIHSLLEDYMRTGKAPNPKGHPVQHQGFVYALVKWLLKVDPEPVIVEEVVASPVDGYAGRIDLGAMTRGLGGRVFTTIDAKTQERAGIYLQAHAQLALYNRAHIACGGDEPERSFIVVFAANGEYREMELAIDEEAVDACLNWYRFAHPVEAMCMRENEAQKKARRQAAA